jgi:hypothetical protein
VPGFEGEQLEGGRPGAVHDVAAGVRIGEVLEVEAHAAARCLGTASTERRSRAAIVAAPLVYHADAGRASRPTSAPTRSTRSGSQVAQSADPQGTQVAVGPAGPGRVPRAPLGPSVSWIEGMPRRGTAAVDHMSVPAVSAAFSSSVSSATSLAMSVIRTR